MTIRILSAGRLPPSLARPIALARTGVPRFWAAVYEIISLSDLRNRTTQMHLQAIDGFYCHVQKLHGEDCLDRMLHEIDVDGLANALEAFFLREHNFAVQTGIDRRARWQSVARFVEVILKHISDSRQVHSTIKSKVRELGARSINLRPNPRRKHMSAIRALPSTVLHEIYEIFDPESVKNPFRSGWQRWRNQCLLLAFLHQGLRRGEALLLTLDAIQNGIDDQTLRIRLWMNVQDKIGNEDPRHCDPPSIKNTQSIRQIPISPNVAAKFQHFCDNYRGRSPYPHLFLNARGMPLGSRSISDIMRHASDALSYQARQILLDAMREPKISAHDLRHTCAVVRLYHYRADGIPEEEALQKLRAFFGWTYASTMPRLYARAYWERHVAEIWNDDFDAHVNAIRVLEHGQE